MSFQLCYIKLSHTRVYHPLKSPFKNYKLSASFHSVHIFPISPSSTSTEVVEDGCFDHSLNWFDQPTAFQRANMQGVSESHPLTFSTYYYCSLWFSQTSLSAVMKAVLKTWNFHLLFQRVCRDKAGCGNLCFHQGERSEGVLSSSKVRSGSQTINFT